ncbi:hypothetical protein [Clostridium sp.]|uniref:hypothetical protein n=1 Tax=Clostridium sp. TaxID=1506 RepID=UPI0035216992
MGCTNSNSNNVSPLCYGGLKDLHNLVKDFLVNNEDVSDDLDENLEEIVEAFCNLKCTLKDQQCTLESYVEIKEWLDKNGDCYDCNAESCECKNLNKDVERILKEITKELLEALNDLNSAIKKLENVQCLENKLDKAFQKYVKCVHKENNSCEC